MAKLPILTPSEKERLKTLKEIYNKHNMVAFNLALIEIWTKGTTHFSDKTLKANISYFKDLSMKKEDRKSIISSELNLESYEIVKELIDGNITPLDIMRFNAREKLY